MHLDLGTIAAWVVALSTIAGVPFAMYKAIKKQLNKYVLDRIQGIESSVAGIQKDVAATRKWTEKQQYDIADGAERDSILMETQLASLEAIHEDKNNGNITRAIEKLRGYMLKKSSKPSSYAKE